VDFSHIISFHFTQFVYHSLLFPWPQSRLFQATWGSVVTLGVFCFPHVPKLSRPSPTSW